MQQVVGYWIAAAHTGTSLERVVNERIEAGWQPIGGVVAMYNSAEHHVYWYQAMVKYAPQHTVNRLNISVGATERARAYTEDAQHTSEPAPENSQLLEAATFAMHALTDRQPGSVPNGEEALARLVSAVEGTELHARWTMPPPDRPYSTPDEDNAEQGRNKE